MSAIFGSVLLLAFLHLAVCAPVQRCQWNGTYYKPGESFNYTLHFNETTVCSEECLCQEEGNVTCINRTCAPATCDTTSSTDKCSPPKKGSCLATDNSGRVILEGETYNPIVPGVGLIRCITCSCMAATSGGFISRCMKLPCPPPVPCGRQHPPIDEYVSCCPACVPEGFNSTPTPSSITLATCAPNPALTQNIYVSSTEDSVAIENTITSTVSLYMWTTSNGYTVTNVSTQQFYETKRSDLQLVGKSTAAYATQLNTSDNMANLSGCTHNCAQTVVAILQVVPLSALC